MNFLKERTALPARLKGGTLMFKKIMTTTDGSELSLRGVENAAELAKQLGASLLIVAVEEPYSYSSVTAYRPESFEQYHDRMEKETGEWLKAAVNAAEKVGVKPSTKVVQGVVVPRMIADTAAEEGQDLIVIASHGRAGLSAVLLGSVAREVVSYSKVPVLLYR